MGFLGAGFVGDGGGRGIDQKSENRKYLCLSFNNIYGDWGKLRILNLTRMSLRKCYWMLANARVTAFTVSDLLKEKPPLRLELSSSVTCEKIRINEPWLLIIALRFTCSERKICSANKKSQNIMDMIFCKVFFYFLCSIVKNSYILVGTYFIFLKNVQCQT